MRVMAESEPKKLGRPPLSPERREQVVKLWILTKLSVDQIAKETGVSRAKCFQIARELNSKMVRGQ